MDLQKRAKLIISADMEGDLEYVVNQLKCDLFLTRPRLRDAMKDEIAEFIQLNTGVSQLRNLDRRFFFASGRKVYILQEHEILLYESTDKVGVVVTREQKLIVDVRDLRKKWGIRGSEKFVRCNPCDYVNIDYIREYDRHWLILEWVNNPVPVTKIGWENLERMRHLFIRND